MARARSSPRRTSRTSDTAIFATSSLGMRHLEARLPIDQNREGLTGWSYGGFMTMFAVTQTTRFHAAGCRCGHQQLEELLRRETRSTSGCCCLRGPVSMTIPRSTQKAPPSNTSRRVKTPTLVVVGDRDGEMSRTPELRVLARASSRRRKDTARHLSERRSRLHSPEHRVDVLERALNWFETPDAFNSKIMTRQSRHPSGCRVQNNSSLLICLRETSALYTEAFGNPSVSGNTVQLCVPVEREVQCGGLSL